ncbi:hypothetical protein CALCODRAFT_517956 [Calocera cornea HHB12733]|uniref:Uncharacterized protein n=1 Tax=Calocera cornea HHB12733 TaxID=1353952 RepID=A0A165FH05_9BASI|nr:hypothetical protein CALCODRAFT_517956 [Calocera cornea HHB12733]
MKALPTEIWREIFLVAYHSLPPVNATQDDARFDAREMLKATLMEVCTSWRDIIVDTSALWVDLISRWQTEPDMKTHVVETVIRLQWDLEQSRRQPLNVFALVLGDFESSLILLFLETLIPHINRVRFLMVGSIWDETIESLPARSLMTTSVNTLPKDALEKLIETIRENFVPRLRTPYALPPIDRAE